MIRSETLFIVGAGASAEFGLPIGRNLTSDIAACLRWNSDYERNSELTKLLVDGVRTLCEETQEFSIGNLFSKAAFMHRGLSQASSIDAFVQTHSDDLEIAMLAKLSIAACIWHWENKSKLHLKEFREGDPVDFSKVQDTWIAKLFNIMAAGSNASNPADIFNKAAFIIFNYDRCIEHYFIYSLHNYYGVLVAAARQAVSKCRIIHPYGTLGQLADHRPLGWNLLRASGRNKALLAMAKSIRTFSEITENQEGEARIKQWVSQAHRLVFLGFGFQNEQNVELLRGSQPSQHGVAKATAFDLSESNQFFAKRDIARMLQTPLNVAKIDLHAGTSGTCAHLIESEQLFLSR